MYKIRARDINKSYGDYVLVNTSFPIANHKSASNPPENILNRDTTIFDYNKEMYLHMLDLIDEMAAQLPQQTIVVRPHPSENHESYHQTFDGRTNIKTIHKGDVREWICGSHVVVHNSCTTGIEAALLDKPVIAYDPVESKPGIRSDLPNKMSMIFEDKESVIEEIKSSLNHEEYDYSLTNMQKSHLKKYIDNLNYKSAERILSVINEVDIDGTVSTTYSPPIRERLKREYIRVFSDRSFAHLKQTGLIQRWKVSTQKFPYLTDSEFARLIEQHRDLLDYPSVSFQRIDGLENVFLVTKSST